ncbi:MAG: cell division protein FtsL [Deltaproteobacteria bacterium]|nr:cell division protein FtsL [Deltaproteobacteria bacterium]
MRGRHFAAILGATLLTCAFVWVRLQIVSISYDINELEKRERSTRDECSKLTLQINEAKSPQRLEHIARLKLGMHPPRPDQNIVLSLGLPLGAR